MGRYLKLYKKWAKTGFIKDDPNRDSPGKGGLCNTVIGRKAMEIFTPQGEDRPMNVAYYASDISPSDEWKDQAYIFSETRQNMVLLLSVINDEF